MHERVGCVAGIRFVALTAQSDVTFFKEVTRHIMGKEHPHPDIELLPVNQIRILEILLDNKCICLDNTGSLGYIPYVVIRIQFLG